MADSKTTKANILKATSECLWSALDLVTQDRELRLGYATQIERLIEQVQTDRAQRLARP